MLTERIGNFIPRPPARAAMFDFDGTVALVRSGWMPAMMEMIMAAVGPLARDPEAERAKAEDYVARLTGKDTIHQMIAFADHVRAVGGAALPALQYKTEFFALLAPVQAERLQAVREGQKPASSLLVPGTVAFLEALRARGVRLYLASGTKHDDIVAESELLGIAQYFDDIHGSAPDRLPKRELLESIVASGVPRDEVITFGDGRVEIEASKAVGGIAVGVASDEEASCLTVDPKKRGWLMEAGADYIVANYLDPDVLRIVTGEI
jgi:phosphoglycolate phosphatase-like HAD superfamily hydrolase